MSQSARQMWDQRYAASDAVWSRTPNMWVEQVASGLRPGTALDLAAGEGRNALWLAENGWDATAVDFSEVALDRARRWAAEGLPPASGRLTTVLADLLDHTPQDRFDLVLVVYLQLPTNQRRKILRGAAEAVAPGGRLLVVAHDPANLTDGVGGPQDPQVLYSAHDVADDVAGLGLTPERLERALRTVTTGTGEQRSAVDALALLVRA